MSYVCAYPSERLLLHSFFDGWLCYLSLQALASANRWPGQPRQAPPLLSHPLKLLWFSVYSRRESGLPPWRWQFAWAASTAIASRISARSGFGASAVKKIHLSHVPHSWHSSNNVISARLLFNHVLSVTDTSNIQYGTAGVLL